MLRILLIIAPLFLVIGLGNILKRRRLMPTEYIQAGNLLLSYVFLPLLLFYNIHASNLTEVFNPVHLAILAACTVLVFVLSYPLGHALELSAYETNTFAANNYRSNIAFIGLPVCYYVFGDEGLTIASIMLALIVPLNNVIGIIAFSSASFDLCGIKNLLRDTFFNPIIIGGIIGIIFSLLQISLPDFLHRTFKILVGMVMPIALLNIGASISIEYIRGNYRVLAISSLIKLLILPAMALAVFYALGIQSFTMLEKVLIIMLACPSAQVNYVLSATMKGAPELAISGIVSSTLLSVFSFLFWLSLLTFL